MMLFFIHIVYDENHKLNGGEYVFWGIL